MGFADSMKKMLGIQNVLDPREQNAKQISSAIAKYQFSRVRQDVQTWREAITEAELAWYPHRVKMQRIFMDTILEGHVSACIRKRKNLVNLKDFGIYNGKVLDEKQTELLNQDWFYNAINYIQEAKFFGYSLIQLGDIVNNSLPQLTVIKRENISPDRLNIVSLIYQISGIDFMNPAFKDEDGISYSDWCVYIPTPTDRGQSPCGYGLLYEVALYQIMLRNLTAANATYIELYGQPLKWFKTSKLEGAEFDALERAAANIGSNGYIITDPTDEIDFVDAGNAGTGYKSYDNFEKRLQDSISKIILGHADAMSSTPGKLGADQGGEVSAVAQAIAEVEKSDTRFVESIMNDVFIPKLINLGFTIKPGMKFKFKNDKEEAAVKKQEDEANLRVATIAKTLKDAGLKMDADYFTKRTTIPVEEVEEPVSVPFSEDTKKKINNLYSNV